jgi:protein gp37
MAENSKIEWTDHTFNPWIGCTKVSPGCTNCYAEQSTPTRVARGYGRELWGKGQPRQRTSESNWRQPIKWNRDAGMQETCGDCDPCTGGRKDQCAVARPRRPRIFCASLSDWLDDEVPIEWLADLLKLIRDTPNLDWLLLTKRPENWSSRLRAVLDLQEKKVRRKPTGDEDLLYYWVADWGASGSGDTRVSAVKPPNNVWIGTTVEDQKRAEKRIHQLLKIPAKVRFLSCEPMLEAIDLPMIGDGHDAPIIPGIHWAICGGESGSKKRPFNPDWARSLRDQCKAAGVPFFMKQVDKIQPIPDDLMIREFPQVTV